jgi:tetrahydromethanopterin S-methyltransferase subunit H
LGVGVMFYKPKKIINREQKTLFEEEDDEIIPKKWENHGSQTN